MNKLPRPRFNFKYYTTMNYKKLLSIVALAATIGGLTSCGSTDANNDSMWSERLFTPGNYAGQISYNEQGVWTNYALNTSGQTYDGLHLTYAYDAAKSTFTGMVPSCVYNPVDYGTDFNTYPNWAGVIDLRNAAAEDVAPTFGEPFMMARFNPSESTTSIPANPSVAISFVTPFYPEAMTVCNSSALYYEMKRTFTPDSRADKVHLVITGVRGGKKTGSVEVALESADNGEYITKWTTVSLSALNEVDYIYMQLVGSEGAGKAAVAKYPYFAVGSLAYAFGYNQ